MNIIRKIKLEKLGYYICKNNKEKDLFKFIKENLLNLTEIKLEESPNEIFWFNNTELIFNYDIEFEMFGIRENIINYLSNKEINNLIKDICKSNKEINRAYTQDYSFQLKIEELYKFSKLKAKINDIRTTYNS